MADTNLSTNILNVPAPTKERGQRSLSAQDAYFTRFLPTWTTPSGLTAEQWRFFVRLQPVAMDCKDILTATLQSLDWKVTPRESEMRDELKATVRYYTKLLEQGGFWLGLDWTGFLEWLANDLLDLPFGAAAEIGRRNDAPDGRVVWVKPLDGGTLYPTLNKDFPVMQYYTSAVQVVNFPAHAIARMYMNPRPEIIREGWGMAPPERIYLAMEMLARGDSYYANLLLDVPPAGILDLGDMDKETALDWISAFRTFVANGGADGFKIPVLYEHTTEPKFIPFGKVPNDIMYDKITLKYASLVTAAYGMSLGDIGLAASSSGAETLAGGIRSERKTRRTGVARAKKKLKFFIESFLPDTLQFDFVDMDDELATAMGRARLANATAWGQLIERGIFDRKEARLQTIQDGLVTISLPEEPPTKDDWQVQPAANGKKSPKERPGMLGSAQPPSQGGDGEVKLSLTINKSRYLSPKLKKYIKRICEDVSPILINASDAHNEDTLYLLRSVVDDSLYGDEDVFNIGEILKAVWVKDGWTISSGETYIQELSTALSEIVDEEELAKIDVEKLGEDLKHRVSEGLKVLIGKACIGTLKDLVLTEKVFDADTVIDYDNIVETMRKNVVDSFDEYASLAVRIEVDKLLQEYR